MERSFAQPMLSPQHFAPHPAWEIGTSSSSGVNRVVIQILEHSRVVTTDASLANAESQILAVVIVSVCPTICPSVCLSQVVVLLTETVKRLFVLLVLVMVGQLFNLHGDNP